MVTLFIADITPPFMNIVWTWGMTFISLNSLFNPIIYCWRIKTLRYAFLGILHLQQAENSSPAIEMQTIPRHHRHVPPTSSEAFSTAVGWGPKVLVGDKKALSIRPFCHQRVKSVGRGLKVLVGDKKALLIRLFCHQRALSDPYLPTSSLSRRISPYLPHPLRSPPFQST